MSDPEKTPSKKQKTKRRGRPPGAKDLKKRKPPNYEKFASTENLPVSVDKRMSKRDMLFKREIDAYGFKTAWEIFNFFSQLKESLDDAKANNNGIIPIDKQTNDRAAQVIDLLKFIAGHEFARVKPIDLNPQQSDKVVLNFNLNNSDALPPPRVEQLKPEDVMDLLQSPDGGFSLPVPLTDPAQ